MQYRAIDKFMTTATNYRKKASATLANTGVADWEYFKNKVVDQLERLEMLKSRGDDFELERQEARDHILYEYTRICTFDGKPEATCGDPLDHNISHEDLMG